MASGEFFLKSVQQLEREEAAAAGLSRIKIADGDLCDRFVWAHLPPTTCRRELTGGSGGRAAGSPKRSSRARTASRCIPSTTWE
jgi:hypothetical protein